MKKLVTLAFAAALMVLGCGDAYAAKYNLKMQTYLPPSCAHSAKRLVERMSALTNGEVEIQLYTGGELVSSPNILKSVRSGMIDIGHGMGMHFPEMKTGTLESGLPMAWMTPMEASILFDEKGLFQIFEKEYEKHGVTWLGPTWSSMYHTLSKKPIKSLEDMRSMKFRAVGATAKMLAALNIPVANISPEDLYVALATGQVDGAVYGNATEYKETKFYESAGYLLVTPFINPINDCLIINKKLFDSMPKNIQEAFRVAAYEARWYWYVWSEAQALGVQEELFKGKMTTLPEEDQRELVKAALKVWEEEAKRSPEMAAGVEIVKAFAKAKGRLQ